MVPTQTAVTRDNVSIGIDGVLYVRVVDAYAAAYGVEDAHFAITQLAQTTMRSEIGKLTLDATFLERDQLNASIVESINAAAVAWGIQCMRYEIRDIAPPPAVRAAMEMQAEAERRRRALILDSEGEQEAEINLAKGKKAAVILASEAAMQERINLALGDARAIEAQAEATANAVRLVAAAVTAHGGQQASTLRVAEQYVSAFKQLAASGSTVVVPANMGDVSSMVATAMAIYRNGQGVGMAPQSGLGGGSGEDGGGGDEMGIAEKLTRPSKDDRGGGDGEVGGFAQGGSSASSYK
jgi:regulator of protease activity HflC (stomatin/prohibitin superfamily)